MSCAALWGFCLLPTNSRDTTGGLGATLPDRWTRLPVCESSPQCHSEVLLKRPRCLSICIEFDLKSRPEVWLCPAHFFQQLDVAKFGVLTRVTCFCQETGHLEDTFVLLCFCYRDVASRLVRTAPQNCTLPGCGLRPVSVHSAPNKTAKEQMNNAFVDSHDIVDMDEHDGDLLAGMVVRLLVFLVRRAHASLSQDLQPLYFVPPVDWKVRRDCSPSNGLSQGSARPSATTCARGPAATLSMVSRPLGRVIGVRTCFNMCICCAFFPLIPLACPR